jgi:hypothetical protein
MQKLEHGRHHEGTHGRGEAPRQHEEQPEPQQAGLRSADRPQAGGRAVGRSGGRAGGRAGS